MFLELLDVCDGSNFSDTLLSWFFLVMCAAAQKAELTGSADQQFEASPLYQQLQQQINNLHAALQNEQQEKLSTQQGWEETDKLLKQERDK